MSPAVSRSLHHIFVVLLLRICRGAAVNIVCTCTARRYTTVAVLAAEYCRTAASLLAACSSYASAVRILHEHYLPLLQLAAAVELTIHTSVQGSRPGRAQWSVLLHLDMSTYEYSCCWCCCTYRVVPCDPSLVVASLVTSRSRTSCCC